MKKMRKLSLVMGAILLGGLTLFTACNKEEETFTMESLMAGDIDLAGLTAATDVPEDAIIKAIFSSAVDAATVTKDNFAITLTEGGAVDYSLSHDGAEVSITPTDSWAGGSQFSIALSSSIMGTNGVSYSGNNLTFRTSGIFVPQKDKQVLFLSFDEENLADEAGMHTVSEVGTLTYESDRWGTAGSAAYFNGEGNLVEVAAADDLISENITISYWFKTALADYNGGDGTGAPQTRFLVGLGVELGYFIELGRRSNDPTSDGFNEIFLKVATDHINIGSNSAEVPKATAWTELNSQINVNFESSSQSGWSFGIDQLLGTNDPLNRTYISDLVMDKWTHFVMTIDAAGQTKTIYLNGVKMGTFQWIASGADWLMGGLSLKSENNDGTPKEGLEASLALGFIGSSTNTATGWGVYDSYLANPAEQKKFFKGSLDQFRIFSVPLSDAEITMLYDNEK